MRSLYENGLSRLLPGFLWFVFTVCFPNGAGADQPWSSWIPIGETGISFHYRWDEPPSTTDYSHLTYQFQNSSSTRRTFQYQIYLEPSHRRIMAGGNTSEPGVEDGWTPMLTLRGVSERAVQFVILKIR